MYIRKSILSPFSSPQVSKQNERLDRRRELNYIVVVSGILFTSTCTQDVVSNIIKLELSQTLNDYFDFGIRSMFLFPLC